MKLHQNEKNIPNSIYSQDVIGGRVSLEKNKTNQSNDIDLELLFNAAMYNSDAILDAIKDGMK